MYEEEKEELLKKLIPFWDNIIEVKNENLLSLFDSSWNVYLKEEADLAPDRVQYYVVSRDASLLEFFVESVFQEEGQQFSTHSLYVKNLEMENQDGV